MKNGLIGAILASGLTVLIAAQTANAQEKPPIKIGHTAPLTGIQALVGQLQSIAVDIGVADINAAGGINGSKLVVIHYDDQLKPDQGVLRIREAIKDGTVGIIGPLSGTQWEVASPLVNTLKFPAININANKPDITTRPYALRLANPDDTGMPETMDDFMKHMPNVKKVVVVGDVREASGKAAVDLWLELARKHNLQILDTVTFTSGMTDFSPAVLKVKDLQPDAILISILGPDAARIGREFATQGVSVPILGNSLIWPGTLPQTLTKVIGKDAGLWYTTGYATNEQSSGDPALFKSFVERYDAEVMNNPVMKQFTPPNVANTMLGWDAVKVIADILRAKGIDGNTPVDTARGALKDGFVELKEYNGLNHIKMRENGDAYIPTRAVRIDPDKSEWRFLE